MSAFFCCGGAATYAEGGRRGTATCESEGGWGTDGLRGYETEMKRGCRGWFYIPSKQRENIAMVQYSPAV